MTCQIIYFISMTLIKIVKIYTQEVSKHAVEDSLFLFDNIRLCVKSNDST